MRSTIDPSESDYYQAVIAYGIDSATSSSLSRCEMTGATLLHAETGSDLDTRSYSTAIVITGALPDDALEAVTRDLLALQKKGTLITAVISSMSDHAENLCRMWQLNPPEPDRSEDDSDQHPAPIFIAADSSADRVRCIKFLNDFTYGAMTICVDWFDVRCESGSWGRPCHYHYTADLPFEDAFAAFNEGIVPGKLAPVVVLENTTFDLGQIETIGEFTEGLGNENSLSILTSVVPCSAPPEGVIIHWLHPR